MEKISRRDFLKLIVAGGASALLSRSSNPEKLFGPSPQEKEIRNGQGVLFIMPASIDGDFISGGKTLEEIKTFESAVGHRVQGLSFFADMDQKKPREEEIVNSFSSGRAIMFNLQPRRTGDPKDISREFVGSRFEAGDHDQTIRKIAKMMAKFSPLPIFVRFAFEMNGDWFNWGGDPKSFVPLWRRMVEIFRWEGASNVKWIFSPNYLPHPERIKNYYPGDAWVDLVGPDIYDWEKLPPEFAMDKINYYLKLIAPNKPLIISELGASGTRKDLWIREAIQRALRQGASAINYFQIDKERDWKIKPGELSKESQRFFSSGIFLNDKATLAEIHETILTTN